MRWLKKLSALALKQAIGTDRAESIIQFTNDRFGNNSARVQIALQDANERAWNAIEISLTGESWWDSLKAGLTGGDESAFRRQVKAFLKAVQHTLPPADQEPFRVSCLAELRAARKAGLIPGAPMPGLDELTGEALALNRFNEQDRLLNEELLAIADFTAELRERGYPNLSIFLALHPPAKRPLLVTAVRYFFRRELENDPRLFAGMTFDQLDSLSQQQQEAFSIMHDTLKTHGERLRRALDELAELKKIAVATLENTEATLEIARDTQQEVQLLRAQMQYQQMLLEKHMAALEQLLQNQGRAVPIVVTIPTTAIPEERAERTEQRASELIALVQQLPEAQRRELAPTLAHVERDMKSLGTMRGKMIRKRVVPSAALFGSATPGTVETATPVPPTPPPATSAEMPPITRPGIRRNVKPNPKLFGTG